MVESTRKKQRISYEEFDFDHIDGMSSDSDIEYILSTDNDHPPRKGNISNLHLASNNPSKPPSASTRSRAKKVKDDDEWTMTGYEVADDFYDRRERRKNGTGPAPSKRVKIPISDISSMLIQENTKNSNDPTVDTNHFGEKCQYVPFELIKNNIYNLEKVIPKGAVTITTIIPNFDPTAEDKLCYFGLTDNLTIYDPKSLENLELDEIDRMIAQTEKELEKTDGAQNDYYLIPPFDVNLTNSIAIKANVLDFDWVRLGKSAKFDVILMDPPWRIQNSKMTRGVELMYDQLSNEEIMSMPLHLVQTDGFVFMWVVASEFSSGLKMLEYWGYEYINGINWVKTSRKGIFHPSNGYFVQHCKESLLVGIKGKGIGLTKPDKFSDLINCPRNLRQSHKPNQLYQMIEEMIPGGKYLEIFARPHNLRDNWVSIGLELPAKVKT